MPIQNRWQVDSMQNQQLKVLKDVLNWTADYFKDISTSPRLDAELLLSHVLEKDRLYLYLNYDMPLSQKELSKFRNYVLERKKGKPVAYIINKREFMGMEFFVNETVMVPRPETELLVEEIIKFIKLASIFKPYILEIGIGSGAISISLAKYLKEYSPFIIGTDSSVFATKCAKKNMENYKENFYIISGQFERMLSSSLKFDIIVSNPPYIGKNEKIDKNVVRWEPHEALFSPDNGLYHTKEIISFSKKRLVDRGILVLEINPLNFEYLKDYIQEKRMIIKKQIYDYSKNIRGLILVCE